MSVWGRIFAAMYDRMLAASEEAGLADRRADVIAAARGRVLEIGAGTGNNLRHYPPDGIDELVLTEPEAPMARRLEDRVAGAARDVQVLRAGADELPFADASFDTVVSTLVLCTVPDPDRALAEIRRVLAPGGRLLFLEHVRNDDPGRARWQDRITPIWRHVAHGCHPNRETPRLIAEAGFAVSDVDTGHFPKGPKVVQPLVSGVATR
ncbi:MAG TPA: methyltransferase domain-containing protein [Solirubrobacteraceae bacterium]